MQHVLMCKCSEVILKSQNGEVKIRGKLVVIRNNKTYSVCKGCGAEVQIPLSFDNTASFGKNLPLYIDKSIDSTKNSR